MALTDVNFGFLVNSSPVYKRNLVIKNLINPEFPNSYDIRANFYYKDSTLATYVFSKFLTAVVVAPNLGGATGFALLATQPLSQTVLFIQIEYGLSLPSGLKTLIDPFTEYSFIDIGLQKGALLFKNGRFTFFERNS